MSANEMRAGRRYASALFAAASRQSAVEAVVADLDAIQSLLDNSTAFRQIWHSPLIPAGRKRAAIDRTLKQALHPLTFAFINLLVTKRRETIVDEVRREMHRQADRAGRIIRAEATFAVEPTAAERDALMKGLEARTGHSIDLRSEVNPAILGGVIVKMQDTIMDGSVRGALDRLREKLLQEA